MDNWLAKVKDLIDKKIETLKITTKVYNVHEILKDPEVKSDLKSLQENYVFTPIDKATGNISLICKRFYAQVLIKELGITHNNIQVSQTYVREIHANETAIINEHIEKLKTTYGFHGIDEENKRLPSIYWLP